MQPQRTRSLHRFDARSLILFASLTMGGTQAVLAEEAPSKQRSDAHTVQTAPAAQATPPKVPAPTVDQAFDRADSNGDGKLTLHEAERYPAVSEHFAQLDRDKNGSLSREEFAQGIKHP